MYELQPLDQLEIWKFYMFVKWMPTLSASALSCQCHATTDSKALRLLSQFAEVGSAAFFRSQYCRSRRCAEMRVNSR
jgi:hypothetical protein